MPSLKGQAAFITGAGSGIGRELALQLARAGCSVTAADLSLPGARETVALVEAAGGQGLAVACDVGGQASQEAALKQHLERFGGLHIAILNAGIYEAGDFLQDASSNWEAVLRVDLVGAMLGLRLVAQAMLERKQRGTILLLASAGGIYPMPIAPVYATAKAGLVNFGRSVAPLLAPRGIRVGSLCPQPVDTPMVAAFKARGLPMPETGAAMMTAAQVAEAALSMLGSEWAKPGRVVYVRTDGRAFDYAGPGKAAFTSIAPAPSARAPPDRLLAAWAAGHQPRSAKKLQVHRLDSDYRAAVRLVSTPLPQPKNGELVVRVAYAGVNASDINHSAGRYFGAAAAGRLPFDSGFDSCGVVRAVGPGVEGWRVGDPVAALQYGAFSEFLALPARQALPVPCVQPALCALLTSGLTASIGLEKAARLQKGETVLVTAAAGGTGQFVVQLAAARGCHVIATCGSPQKGALLRRLGAHRVILYREEDLKGVLKREYPRGVDVVWESVGGQMLHTCVRALAPGGRLVIIGSMSSYAAPGGFPSGWEASKLPPGVPELLLWRGASIAGFFLLQHAKDYRAHLARLTAAWQAGALQVALDPHNDRHRGLEAVFAAEERLQSGESYGKVVVQVAPDPPPQPSEAPQPRPKL